MPKGLWDRMRGARGIELLVALAVAALIALALLHGVGGRNTPEKTELEARLERILSGIDGAGEVRAMVTQDGEGNVTGALIVANDLEDVSAYLSLQGTVATLLEVDLSKVEIVGRGGRFGGWQ